MYFALFFNSAIQTTFKTGSVISTHFAFIPQSVGSPVRRVKKTLEGKQKSIKNGQERKIGVIMANLLCETDLYFD